MLFPGMKVEVYRRGAVGGPFPGHLLVCHGNDTVDVMLWEPGGQRTERNVPVFHPDDPNDHTDVECYCVSPDVEPRNHGEPEEPRDEEAASDSEPTTADDGVDVGTPDPPDPDGT